ncbi:MAG: DEAD/DEAH box helicase [Candidatus Helarchaeota archaeon]
MKYESEYNSLKEIIFAQDFIDLDEFNKRLLLAKINFNLPDVFYESISSVADFLPHQFRPLMKILDSDTGRLLIADEVGVGKTIEAGYIISELLARNEINNILIVCPKNLVPKWIMEMKRFFNEDFEMVNDSKDLLMKFRKRSTYPKLVVGLELLRKRDIVEKLSQGLLENNYYSFQEFEPFDMLIFDEAHHLRNPETLSHKIAKILLENCDYALFLTATPINTSLEDLMNLLNLLVYQGELTISEFNEIMEPNRFLIRIQVLLDSQPIGYIKEIESYLKKLSEGNVYSKLTYSQILEEGSLIRFIEDENYRTAEIRAKIRYTLEQINRLSAILNNTRKRDIADHESLFPIRHPEEPLLVTFTEPELDFYLKARKFFINLIIRRSKGGFIPIQLIEIMPQRVVASSINGTFMKLKKMLKKHNEELDQTEIFLDFEDLDFQEEDFNLNSNPFLLTSDEIEEINELLEYERIIGNTDSKFDAVVERLRKYFLDGNSQVIIFSYFKSTIEYITKRLNEIDFSKEEKFLEHSIRAEYIHGDIKIPQREEIFRKFKENKIQILVLSDIGAEGIDLQFCNCLINYDLPWNPMKLEQRIGRLDRYGQKNTIFITNVYVKNSIEDRILHRLFKRISMIQENLIFLNPILKEYFRAREKFFYKPERTEEELEEIVKKIEENLNLKKEYVREIEEKLSGLKGDTSKALLYEQKIIEEKRNSFSLEDLFKTFIYLFNKNFPNSSIDLCKNNSTVLHYLKSKNIPILDNLYYININRDFRDILRNLEIKPESVKQQVNIFLNRIDNAMVSPKKRRFKPIIITYDKMIANKYRNEIDLLSLKHILIKILLFINKERHFEKLCTTIKPKANFPYNSLLLIYYLLKVEGIRTDSKMELIGYDFTTKELLSDEELNKIQDEINSMDFENLKKIFIEHDLIEEGFKKCFSKIISIKNDLQKKLEIKMKNIYEYKREQLTRRYDNKIRHLNQILNKVRGKKIEKLYLSQINKNLKRKEEDLTELRHNYEKSIAISIIEIGSILIQNE